MSTDSIPYIYICMCLISNYRESATGIAVTIVPKRDQQEGEKNREKTYIELIRCHYFGSNLTLVYNLRCSLFFFLFSIQYAY